MADEPQDTPQDEPAPEEPTAEQPAAEEPEATPEQPEAATEPADEPEAETSAEEAPAEEVPVAESDEAAPAEAAAESETSEAPAEKPKPKRKKDAKADEPDVIPGAHLEPDLVLEEEKKSRAQESGYVGAEVEIVEEVVVEGETAVAEDSDEDEAPKPLEAVLNLAADARYRATGKRKSAVARVTLKPGTGVYTINGKSLDEYFPRASLQTKARLPLVTVGQQERMDVVAKIHGGGVSSQAGALRHGITRALVEADPNLRGELKRRGFLTRDPRVKERKKAGFKKARKRPQFSKR
jgi:small subunit ribosomal protein S9